MIQGYASLENIGEVGDQTFNDLIPSENLRLLSILERISPNPLAVAWIPCPDGTLIIPRQPERQYADNLVQWVIEKRAAIIEAARLVKEGELTWRSGLEFLLYYPAHVTAKGDYVRGVSVYLPQAPFTGNLATISAVALMKVPNLEEACSDPLEVRIFPEAKTERVEGLWNSVKELANPLAEKVRALSNEVSAFSPSQAVFADARVWVNPLRRTEEHTLLSLTVLETGTRPISGLLGTSRQMNEELSKKLTDDTLGKDEYEELIQNLRIVDLRVRETVW
ncbi:MAG: hypothetical protein ACXAB4_02335 [Candidatus Hodarchaeales archaeon]|jgi:hypothetical protein